MKLYLILLAAVSLATAFAAEEKFTLPRESVKLKPGSGAEIATAQCLVCHSADYISTQPLLTRGQWQASVIKMQQKYGAPIPTNTIERLVDYLTANYGRTIDARK
jgi:sulfite dehydrogenase (cytochrome) subunit B